MVFKLNRAHRMRDALERVLNRMREIVKRIDAPLIPLPVVRRVQDAVNGRVAQVHIRAGHIDFRAQRTVAVGELAGLHPLKQRQIFLHAAVSVGAFHARLGQRAARSAHFVGAQVADIRLPRLDEFDGEFVAFVEIIAAVKNRVGMRAEPFEVLADGNDVLVVLLRGVGIVVAQIEQAAVLLRGRIVDIDRLGAADVQVAVRLGRKAGMHALGPSLGQIALYDVKQKVGIFLHRRIHPFP